jgi:hypothetical protein
MDALERDGYHYQRRMQRFILPDGSSTGITALENHARACAPTLLRRLGLSHYRAAIR